MSAQFSFLNALRRERRLVVLYLIGGTRLQGRIASFDQRGVLLETKTGMVLCSQDQISTVGPDAPRSLLRSRGRTQQAPQAGAALAHESEVPERDAIRPVALEDGPLAPARLARAHPEDAPSPEGPARAPVITQKPRRKIIVPDLQTGTGV